MRLDWEVVTVEPETPFRISRGTHTEVSVVWVRIEADGVEGWGEADPTAFYGESVETVEAALGSIQPVLEHSAEPERLETLEHAVQSTLAGGSSLRGSASARAAVSAALHDLVGKRAGVPVWQMLGLDPAAAPLSSFTIGLGTPEEMSAKAAAAHFPVLKIKLGTEHDLAIIRAVREAAPRATLRVDANSAWTAAEAVDRIRELAVFGVEFVEQPLPPGDRDGYRTLYGEAALPIIHDESCLVASDIPGLVGLGDGINIKLAKCGGIREALRMIHTARACDLKVMMGCMLETTLGIAAAAQLAPLLDYADLDGAALLRVDPFDGPGFVDGSIVLSQEPGLGVARA